MQSFRTREIPSIPRHSTKRRQRGSLSFSISEFTISAERLAQDNFRSRQIARLHNDVSKIRGGIRRIPTIIGRDVKFFGFLEGGSCQAQVSEIGESAAFQKFCTCDQELCSAFSAFGGSTRGQCLLTPEIRERARSTRFRNIDSGAIPIRRG